jgi:prevent-host-death family protein
MQTIGMFKAKTHLPEVIRNVQKGQQYIVTNRNQEVAVIMSIQDYKKSFNKFPYEKLKDIFKSNPFMSVDEIISFRDEGRKW